MKKFLAIVLSVVMLLSVCSVNVFADAVDVTTDTFGNTGWESTYDAETKTIVFEDAWKGRGWWFGDDGITPWFGELTISFKDCPIDMNLVVDYAEGFDSTFPISSGATSVTATMEARTVKQIYLQSKAAGTVVIDEVKTSGNPIKYTVATVLVENGKNNYNATLSYEGKIAWGTAVLKKDWEGIADIIEKAVATPGSRFVWTYDITGTDEGWFNFFQYNNAAGFANWEGFDNGAGSFAHYYNGNSTNQWELLKEGSHIVYYDMDKYVAFVAAHENGSQNFVKDLNQICFQSGLNDGTEIHNMYLAIEIPEEVEVEKPIDPDAVAMIGDTTYNSLEEAVAAAANYATIKLITDISSEEDINLVTENTVEIDLNGKAINADINIDGAVVLSNGTVNGSVVATAVGLEDVTVNNEEGVAVSAFRLVIEGKTNITGAPAIVVMPTIVDEELIGDQVVINTTGEINGDIVFAPADEETTFDEYVKAISVQIDKGTFNGELNVDALVDIFPAEQPAPEEPEESSETPVTLTVNDFTDGGKIVGGAACAIAGGRDRFQLALPTDLIKNGMTIKLHIVGSCDEPFRFWLADGWAGAGTPIASDAVGIEAGDFDAYIELAATADAKGIIFGANPAGASFDSFKLTAMYIVPEEEEEPAEEEPVKESDFEATTLKLCVNPEEKETTVDHYGDYSIDVKHENGDGLTWIMLKHGEGQSATPTTIPAGTIIKTTKLTVDGVDLHPNDSVANVVVGDNQIVEIMYFFDWGGIREVSNYVGSGTNIHVEFTLIDPNADNEEESAPAGPVKADAATVLKAMKKAGCIKIADGTKFLDSNVKYLVNDYYTDGDYTIVGKKAVVTPAQQGVARVGANGHIYVTNEYHAFLINGFFIVSPHNDNGTGWCPVCCAVIEYEDGAVPADKEVKTMTKLGGQDKADDIGDGILLEDLQEGANNCRIYTNWCDGASWGDVLKAIQTEGAWLKITHTGTIESLIFQCDYTQAPEDFEITEPTYTEEGVTWFNCADIVANSPVAMSGDFGGWGNLMLHYDGETTVTAIEFVIPGVEPGTVLEDVDIEVIDPTESDPGETEDDPADIDVVETPVEETKPEKNPTTGLTLCVLPMIAAAFAAVASKRR